MKTNRITTFVASLVLVGLGTASVFALRKVESVRGHEATLEEVLYLPSGKTLKKISLGYSGLLADIYWTRAVQYFGARHLRHATRYDLLYPLLDITTDLDPHLIPAYQSGSIFLCQKVPEGAGQPDKAVTLLEKGIRENPKYWRLYYTLGFVHYFDRRDYRAAQIAFETGAEIPGALPWMRVMAARMAEHASDISTAILLWQGVLEMTQQDQQIRDAAIDHVNSLKTDLAIEQLEGVVQAYRQKTGTLPSHWLDLTHAGMLPGMPVDLTGSPFKLMPDGSVQVEDPSKFRFLGEGRARNK
jgi:hypothetical protein